MLKYYDDHKQEFVRPEQVVVREIFVSTEGKTGRRECRAAEEGRRPACSA